MKAKDKADKIYALLVQVAELRGDLVANHGEEMTEEQRNKVIEIWNADTVAGKAAFELTQMLK